MRLLMYRGNATARLGALRGNEVVDLQALAEASGETLPGDILGLIDAGPEALERAKSLLENSGADTVGSCQRSVTNLELLPPLNPPRGNVLAIGHNYMEHAQESARARGSEVTRPTVFTKAQTSITGPYSDIGVDRSVTDQVDWEAELGVVIGRTGKNISREQGLEYVFGYTVVNDVSARDLQFGWGGQFFKGKSLDGFCPVGPWIVTTDEIPDPQDLRLCLRVNGETKQDGTTKDMIFPVAELVAQLSLGMTLPAGTLIASGTPAGVGFARDPKEFLQNGDVMETEIEGIGCLRNRIVDSGNSIP